MTKQFTLKRGLDVPVEGAPEQVIHNGPDTPVIGVLGIADYVQLKPRLMVEEGDIVGAGAPIYFHKDAPDVYMTSPVSGRVKAINRGVRRVLISVEIERDDNVAPPVNFNDVGDASTVEGIVERLCKSGLWTSFKTRPYSKTPMPDTRPSAIFINAMDTEPLSADPEVIISEQEEAFLEGLKTIVPLSDGEVFLCKERDAVIPGTSVEGVEVAGFSGPHPAGLPGTHIHFLKPPNSERLVWTIGYQDVIAIGNLMMTGTLNAERIVALCGPLIEKPRLVRTVIGASLKVLSRGEYDESTPVRLISGSILSGHSSEYDTGHYLGRHARQITVIKEDKDQIPLGWIRPMANKFSAQPVLASAILKRVFPMTSNQNGGRRAMVPLGLFEELMPQDYLPTQLLKALLVMDTDTAQALGALELDEEDLGLVGFACPAKYEYGMALRDCLTKIEKEG
ncbi:MAG: Na(+)-translocating NADH-quinone reductase subunit A [Pseudomonadota bacterium]